MTKIETYRFEEIEHKCKVLSDLFYTFRDEGWYGERDEVQKDINNELIYLGNACMKAIILDMHYLIEVIKKEMETQQ